MRLRPETVKKCVLECVSVYTSVRVVTLRLSFGRMIKNTFLHHLMGVAATSRPELVFFVVFKTSAGTSDVPG